MAHLAGPPPEPVVWWRRPRRSLRPVGDLPGLFVVLAFVTLTLMIVTVVDIVGIIRAVLSGDTTNVDLPYTAGTAALAVLGVASWVFYLSRPVERD